jgi:hypothetical protein
MINHCCMCDDNKSHVATLTALLLECENIIIGFTSFSLLPAHIPSFKEYYDKGLDILPKIREALGEKLLPQRVEGEAMNDIFITAGLIILKIIFSGGLFFWLMVMLRYGLLELRRRLR